MCSLFGVSLAPSYDWAWRIKQLNPDQERMQCVQETDQKSRHTIDIDKFLCDSV